MDRQVLYGGLPIQGMCSKCLSSGYHVSEPCYQHQNAFILFQPHASDIQFEPYT